MSVVWFLNKIGEVTLEQWEVHSGKWETWLEARSTVVWFTVAGGARWGCNKRAWKLEVHPLGEEPPAPQRQEEPSRCGSIQVGVLGVWDGGSAWCQQDRAKSRAWPRGWVIQRQDPGTEE